MRPWATGMPEGCSPIATVLADLWDGSGRSSVVGAGRSRRVLGRMGRSIAGRPAPRNRKGGSNPPGFRGYVPRMLFILVALLMNMFASELSPR